MNGNGCQMNLSCVREVLAQSGCRELYIWSRSARQVCELPYHFPGAPMVFSL